MQKTHLAENLRFLCGQYPSVASVCRDIGINRQQFNKYLSATVVPSRHNRERICQFFNVDSSQLELEPSKFREELADKESSEKKTKNSVDLNAVTNSLPSSVDQLKRYQGFYYSHFHALGYPGYVVRSLVKISSTGSRFFTKSIEHLWDKEGMDTQRHRFKYNGIAFYLADRIFITEYETLAKQAICHTILYPSYRSRLDYLSGITTGVGSLHTHQPKAARVEFQFLGLNVDVRETLAGCGLFKLDSSQIDEQIKDRIKNQINDEEFMLIAHGH